MSSVSKAVRDLHRSKHPVLDEQSTAYTSQRFNELDSLRGLAACTVVLSHFWSGLGVDTSLRTWHSPFRSLITGHDAVILFFTLSGFVLFLPYERKGGMSYFKFVVKRVCRIYLPYVGALALAITLNLRYHGLVTDHAWVNSTWIEKPHRHLILQHLAFLGDYTWSAFNTAFWSLVYEMRISLIFPLLAIAVLRLRREWMIVIAIFSSLLSSHYHWLLLLRSDPAKIRVADTLHYISFFILGAILAKNREFIQARYKRLPLLLVLSASVLAVLFYYHPFAFPAGALLSQKKITDWSVAFGSLLAISLAVCSPHFKRLLNHYAIHYLGRISYSIYLVHGTVLFTLIYICRGHLRFGYLPIYLIGVLGLASVFHYLIEKPSIVLGQKLGRSGIDHEKPNTNHSASLWWTLGLRSGSLLRHKT